MGKNPLEEMVVQSLSHVWLFATPWTSLPGSSVHEIFQARILEWVAISFSKKNCTKKDLHDPDNQNGVLTHLEPDILECEVKWALGSIKASGGDGILDELFQILKDNAVKVLHLNHQQIWNTHQWT